MNDDSRVYILMLRAGMSYETVKAAQQDLHGLNLSKLAAKLGLKRNEI